MASTKKRTGSVKEGARSARRARSATRETPPAATPRRRATDKKTTSESSEALVVRPAFDPDHRVVAITGACSFLGSELIKRLENDRRYIRVLAIDIRKPDVPLVKTQFYKVDLTLPTTDAEVAQLLKREGVDTLVHLAFLSRPTHNTAWAHELEAIGTLHVLNACAACKMHKVVLWSLTALYGPSPLNPNYLTESDRRRGVEGSRFLDDKLEAERLAHRFRNENPSSVVTVLRAASILGRRIHNQVTAYLSWPIVPVMMGYDPLVQVLHEDDAVDAFKIAVDIDRSADYNIASDGVLPLSTALALAGRLTIPLPHVLAHPLAKTLWMTQVLDSAPSFLDFLRYTCVADTARARAELGFIPRYTIQQVMAEIAGLAPATDAAPGGLHA
jgi:UDP-glucose 4-epimerase